MKKIKYIFLSIFTILVCKIEVNATSMSLALNCPSTSYSGSTIQCTITSNVNGGMINGINANYLFSNASYQSFSPSGSWSIYNNSSNGFAIGNINGSSGGTIGTVSVLINASSGQSATISLINIGASDTDYNDVSLGNVSSTINVIEKPVPITTTRKKVLYLDSLNIEGYDISFNKSTFNYTIDVEYEVSSLNVSATASNGYIVSGTGTIHINEGENTILITVADSTGEKSTYTIKVNRVVKVSNIVGNNIDEITNAFKSNKELIINLDMNKDELVVKKEILDIIKAQDRKLTYNIQNNKDTIYTYIFDGSKFNDFYNDIDLTLNLTNNKKDIIKESLKDEKMIYFENKYTNFFPTGTKLRIKNTTGYHQETRVRLYKLNSENTLELIKNNIKISNKFMEFDIEKGAIYLLSNKTTKSTNTSIILIIISIVIVLELLVIGYLILRKKKQIKIPKLNDYNDQTNENKATVEKLNN